MANGYQIDDLEDAVQALEDVVPDLEIDLNVIDQVEGTVWFYVAYQGANPHEATHPAVTVASHLAEIIAKALGSQAVEEHKALIEAIRNAPLAKPEPTEDDSEDL